MLDLTKGSEVLMHPTDLLTLIKLNDLNKVTRVALARLDCAHAARPHRKGFSIVRSKSW